MNLISTYVGVQVHVKGVVQRAAYRVQPSYALIEQLISLHLASSNQRILS